MLSDHDRDELQHVILRNMQPRAGASPRSRARRPTFARALGPVPRTRPTSPPPSPPPPPPESVPVPETPSPLTSIPLPAPVHIKFGRTLAFHFMSETAGGGGNNEIRVSEYLPYSYIEIRSIAIIVHGNVQLGQYIQLFRANDDNISNTATPTGTNISPVVGRAADAPGRDGLRAIVVPHQTTVIDNISIACEGESYLKVRLFFESPATALPIVSVIVVIAHS